MGKWHAKESDAIIVTSGRNFKGGNMGIRCNNSHFWQELQRLISLFFSGSELYTCGHFTIF